MGTERVTFRLQANDYAKLKRKAAEKGVSTSDLIRQLIADSNKKDKDLSNAEKLVDQQNTLNYLQKQMEIMKAAGITDPILSETLEMLVEEMNSLWQP